MTGIEGKPAAGRRRIQAMERTVPALFGLGVHVLALAIVACAGCGGGSTEPETPAEVPVAAGTIGNGGGTLGSAEFTLTVPAGAFNSDAQLELYETSADHGFGDNTCSKSFRLEGVPPFASPLEVKIKYTGSLSNESFVAVSRGPDEGFMDLYGDAGEMLYDLHPASESDGFLACSIPPSAVIVPERIGAALEDPASDRSGDALRSALSERTYLFNALTDYQTSYRSPHFNVRYPEGMLTHAEQMADFLEAGYDTALAMGLNFDRKQYEWPGTLVIKKFADSGKCIALDLGYETRPPSFHLNADHMAPSEEGYFRRHLGLLMIGAAARTYTGPVTGYVDTWWNRSVAVWAADKFVDPPFDAHSDFLLNNELEPFKGLEDREAGANHAKGMITFVEYLVRKYGPGAIAGTFEEIRSGHTLPTAAIMSWVRDAEYNWHPDYIDRYVRGSIFDVTGDRILRDPTSEWTIDEDADTVMTFPHGCPELGVNLYRINLEYASIASGAGLEFTVEAPAVNPDYLTLLVYKITNNVLELLDSGNSVTIAGLAGLTVEGADLAVFIVNSYNEPPYKGDTGLSMTARVKKSPLYTHCNIEVGLDVTYQREGHPTTWGGHLVRQWRAVGVFEGYTFYGELDRDYHGDGTTGSVTVSIDPATRDVVSITASAVATDPRAVERWSLQAGDIPVYGGYNEWLLEHWVEGVSVCPLITQFRYSDDPYIGDRTDVVQWSCDTDAELEIQFLADTQ
jgi:hypothetical protein